jgi:hypothetical protein
MRIVDPLLPQSSFLSVGLNPKRPAPATRRLRPSFLPSCPPSRAIEIPNVLKHETVAAQSALVAKFVIRQLPLASAAMITARCEIDLSPGRQTRPLMRRAGLIFIATILLERACGKKAKDPVRKQLTCQRSPTTFLTVG